MHQVCTHWARRGLENGNLPLTLHPLLTISTCTGKVFPMSGGENDNLCRERYRDASDTNKKYWDEQKDC